MNIKSLLNSNENLNNNDQSNELYEIIVHKILSISDEIKSFFDALDLYSFEEIPNKEYYSEEFYLILMKEVYKRLFDLLEEKYNLKELNKRIDKLSISLNISSNILDLVSKKFVSFKKPMNPSKFQTHPAVLELFALCAIPAVSLKGRKNTSANNA